MRNKLADSATHTGWTSDRKLGCIRAAAVTAAEVMAAGVTAAEVMAAEVTAEGIAAARSIGIIRLDFWINPIGILDESDWILPATRLDSRQ